MNTGMSQETLKESDVNLTFRMSKARVFGRSEASSYGFLQRKAKVAARRDQGISRRRLGRVFGRILSSRFEASPTRDYSPEIVETFLSYAMPDSDSDALNVAQGSADLSAVSVHHANFCGFYPAMVERIEGQNALCAVQVGKVELQLPFPVEVLKACNLNLGDRFRWRPSADGSVGPGDLELVEKSSDAVELPSDWLRTIVEGNHQDDDLAEIEPITPLVETKIGGKYFLLRARFENADG